MEINLFYVHGPSIGYGRMGVNIARELDEMGITVYDDMQMPDHNRQPHEVNTDSRMGLSKTVVWLSVPTHARGWWSGQRASVMTMWESSRLPESFRETLDHFAQVIVPSKQNLELFSQYHPNVSFVPLGVDPAVWKFTPRLSPFPEFRFMIAGSGPRKGTDLAFQAFREGFEDWGPAKKGPVPKLVFKSPRHEPFHGRDIEVVGGRLSPEAELALYESVHCYLQPSRGEGFGLQPLQALAQGIPTILTAAHGHDAFAHLGLGISAKPAQSAYFIYGDAGDWWEPNLDELIEHMRWVYLNYSQACADAGRAAHVIAEEFTWRRTAERFVEVIGPENLVPLGEERGEWFRPSQRRYVVMTNRDWKSDIAGVTYQWLKGHLYHELADVKRILFEAGLLDPACLSPVGPHGEKEWDTGLTEEQATRIPAYTAANSYCQLCHQRLGSHPTRADDIYAEMEAADANGSEPDRRHAAASPSP